MSYVFKKNENIVLNFQNTCVSDHIVVEVTVRPGESFLDKMIALMEGASRQKTPNELALTILLTGFTIVFAIVPALFMASIPALQHLNVMQLHSPESAIMSAVIFNALIIPALIPLALKGVEYKPIGASALLRRNLFIYGLGGVVVPFLGIKLIDSGVGMMM